MLITTKSLSLHIDKKQIINDLNLEIKAGEKWVVLGKNGIGKSSLLHAISGVSPHKIEGEIYWQTHPLNDIPYKQRAQYLGLLLQTPHDTFPMTVYEAIKIGLGLQQRNASIVAKEIIRIADILELSHLLQQNIQNLSGGEKQRVSIAMLLMQNPMHYILDEPTNHLDVAHQIRVLSLFNELIKNHQKSLLFTTHDLNLAYRYSDKALLLLPDGSTRQGPTSRLFTEENLTELLEYPIKKINADNNTPYWVTG